jgi:translation elongation factor EF-1alpha
MRTIRVKCPQCREVMEINAQTGRIEKHHPEIKTKAGGDFLKERLKGLEEEKAQREAVVAGAREKEKGRKAAHEELFNKVKETAKEGPVERPLRDIDVD